MFQRILVPLDGSMRAERAIPAAARIVRASSHGSIVLMHVVAPPLETNVYGTEPGIGVAPGALERHLDEATTYLTMLTTIYANELKDIAVETEIETGHVPAGIVTAARLEQVDLIVMCSHSETGLRQWLLKHVARQAIRHSPVPVLVLNEQGEALPAPDATRPLRLLIPLDGSLLAEAALEPAVQLISALALPTQQVIVHLLGVIDMLSTNGHMRYQTHIDMELQNRTRDEAERYLQSVAKRIQEELYTTIQLQVTATAVIDTDVPGTIIRQAELRGDAQGNCDLLVMATHGRGGLQRLLLGSVTEHILGHTMLPLLVVRPHEAAIKTDAAQTATAEPMQSS